MIQFSLISEGLNFPQRNTLRTSVAFYGYQTYFIAHLLCSVTVSDPGGDEFSKSLLFFPLQIYTSQDTNPLVIL